MAIAAGEHEHLIVAAGELDLVTAPELRSDLAAALDGRPRAVRVDMSHVTFIDSTAIGVLTGAYRRAVRAGIRLVLVEPSAPVARALKTLGLDRVLEIGASR